MSSIILSNPYAPPAPPAQSTGADPQTALAIIPAQNASAGTGTGDAAGFTGNGSGYGGGPGQQALSNELRGRRSAPTGRPADATPDSVVSAQARNELNPLGIDLPEVAMPDPLPTSPFLKSQSEGT